MDNRLQADASLVTIERPTLFYDPGHLCSVPDKVYNYDVKCIFYHLIFVLKKTLNTIFKAINSYLKGGFFLAYQFVFLPFSKTNLMIINICISKIIKPRVKNKFFGTH